MSDVALSWTGDYFDLGLEKNDLKQDSGLKTAITISLFSDRKVDRAEIPVGEVSRRGWWGDAFAVEGDLTGSRLWLLARAKQTEETRRKAEEYAREALAWLIEDGIAVSVSVTAEWVRSGFLGLTVTVQRPSGPLAFKFNVNWNAEIAGDQNVL